MTAGQGHHSPGIIPRPSPIEILEEASQLPPRGVDSDCICSTCLSIFPEARGTGRKGEGRKEGKMEGACPYGWTLSLSSCSSHVRFEGEPPRADRNQVQLSRGGFWAREKSRAAVTPGWFPSERRNVTSRHVYSSFTRPKEAEDERNTCEEGGRLIVPWRMQIRDVHVSSKGFLRP